MIEVFRKNSDENGVSPVIGVILIVAIVVILAALVGAIMFGFTDQLDGGSSNAAFELNEQSGSITPIQAEDEIEYEVIVDGNKTKTIPSNSVGQSIQINNASSGSTVQIVNPQTEQVVQEWKIDDEEESSKDYEIIEDFEGKTVSNLTTQSISGSPDFSVESRRGSDWANVSVDDGETGAIAISKSYPDYLSGSVVAETSSVGANPYVGVGNGATYVQTIIRSGSFIVEDSDGNQDSVSLNNRDEKKSEFTIDYKFEEGGTIESTLTTNASTYSVSTTTSISDLNSSHQLFGIGSAQTGTGSGNVYFDEFKSG